MSFNPYLFFSDGTCAEAFERYQQIFGGELSIMRHADLPPGAEPMPGARPEHVMHASISIGGALLMGSDDPTGDGGPRSGISVSYTAPDAEAAHQAFEQLTEGGVTVMPLSPTFWSKGFGVCTDRFGVPWMVDTAGDA